MWLVLCAAYDASALWAFQGLQARGLRPLELVTAEALGASLTWEHYVTSGGAVTGVTLPDGRRLESHVVRGALNRLTALPTPHFDLSPDRDYAAQEFAAFCMSWLNTLSGVVLNPVTAQGLCGAWRHVSEWVWLAARAGLPTPSYRQTSADTIDETKTLRRLFPAETPTRTVFVVGRQAVGAGVPAKIQAGCVRLAQMAETPLLGVEFVNGGRGAAWTFAGATPMPELTAGGEPLLDALALTLSQNGKRGI